MSKSGVLDRGLEWEWGIFNARLWKKEEVALITILRIFHTHIIAGAVHEYDIRIVPLSPTTTTTTTTTHTHTHTHTHTPRKRKGPEEF